MERNGCSCNGGPSTTKACAWDEYINPVLDARVLVMLMGEYPRWVPVVVVSDAAPAESLPIVLVALCVPGLLAGGLLRSAGGESRAGDGWLAG